MELLENNTYSYIAVGLGGLILVPQILHGYKRQSLEDLSTITLFFILITSLLWTYYMYEMNYTLYAYISGFVCFNAFVLVMMQLWNYYKRFKQHVKTFETKPKPNKKPEPPVPIILQMPQVAAVEPTIVQEEIKIDIDDLKTEPTVI